MKRLYRVTFEEVMYVVAEDGVEAEQIAEDNRMNNDWEPSSTAILIKSVGELDDDEKKSLPWGDEDDKKTCEMWAQEAEREVINAKTAGSDSPVEQ